MVQTGSPSKLTTQVQHFARKMLQWETYRQLSLDERIEIYRLHADGISIRKTASFINRSPATVSRELRRNSKPSRKWKNGYYPIRAEALTARRRATGLA